MIFLLWLVAIYAFVQGLVAILPVNPFGLDFAFLSEFAVAIGTFLSQWTFIFPMRTALIMFIVIINLEIGLALFGAGKWLIGIIRG